MSRRSDLTAALAVFCINIALCVAFFDPQIMGYGDALRGWAQFNAIVPGEFTFGPHNQIATRLGMALITLGILFALVASGLVERRVLITYLALPFSAYLATKLKIEFLIFPLALISTNLGWKREIIVIALILAISLAIGENNGLVLVTFRILLLLFRRCPVHTLWLLPLIALILFLDANIELLYPLNPDLARFSYTRDIVNPEFSHFETLIVFLSSMVLSIQPAIDFWVTLPYTIFILAMTFGTRLLSRHFYGEILRAPGFRAGFFTVMGFTALTHAFQNARYYFFYIPAFTAIGGNRINAVIILSSVPMTLGLALFYKLYLGM